jgi:hypothetical protein
MLRWEPKHELLFKGPAVNYFFFAQGYIEKQFYIESFKSGERPCPMYYGFPYVCLLLDPLELEHVSILLCYGPTSGL